VLNSLFRLYQWIQSARYYSRYDIRAVACFCQDFDIHDCQSVWNKKFWQALISTSTILHYIMHIVQGIRLQPTFIWFIVQVNKLVCTCYQKTNKIVYNLWFIMIHIMWLQCTAISIKVVPRAKWKSRIRTRKAAGNR
jgi:hypothetical protein